MQIISYRIEDFLLDIKHLSIQIQCSPIRYDSLIAVTRGGIVPAGFLSQSLNIKKLYTCGGYFNQKSNFNFINEPTKIKGLVLMISDLCKTGKTLKNIRDGYLALENKDLSIDIACLHYFSNQSKNVIIPEIFIYKFNEDLFINYPWE